MMLVPYSRKNHSVYNPFQDFDDLEKAFFSDRSLGELKTDIKDLGSYVLNQAHGVRRDSLAASRKAEPLLRRRLDADV